MGDVEFGGATIAGAVVGLIGAIIMYFFGHWLTGLFGKSSVLMSLGAALFIFIFFTFLGFAAENSLENQNAKLLNKKLKRELKIKK